MSLFDEIIELDNESHKKWFNLTARNSPTSKVAGCKGFGLVQ